MKKFILVFSTVLLISTNAVARGPGGHHHHGAPSHHQGVSFRHHQPPRHHPTVVIRHHQPPMIPHYQPHVVYHHGGGCHGHHHHHNGMARAGTILLSTGILALAVSSF
ncbi:MAG: hypothetical protein LBL47_04880 [Lactobacillus sp.]|jgi:hypothetical protein|nr:hypothetical protein [Lactobacillus sp.]